MYKRTVAVPRRTAESIRELEKRLPLLTASLKIPVVDSAERATRIAESLVMEQLGWEEVMDDAVVTETETGWEVSFNIWEEDD
jgi:hypothetical protein